MNRLQRFGRFLLETVIGRDRQRDLKAWAARWFAVDEMLLARATRNIAGQNGNIKLNLDEAQKLGAASNAKAADAFAANVRPIINAITATGVTSARAIAEVLSARGVKSARGGIFGELKSMDGGPRSELVPRQGSPSTFPPRRSASPANP